MNRTTISPRQLPDKTYVPVGRVAGRRGDVNECKFSIQQEYMWQPRGESEPTGAESDDRVRNQRHLPVPPAGEKNDKSSGNVASVKRLGEKKERGTSTF